MRWPWSRKQEARRRSYAGAMIGRLVNDWVAQSTSVDSEIRGGLVTVRNRVRQLERDNDYVRGYLREVENNVIGQGVPFQAQVKMQRGDKLNDAINATIEEKWANWTKARRCHTGGTLEFNEIERLLIRSCARDGEFLVRMVRKKFGDSKIPFALEVIESDLLDESYNDVLPGGRTVKMGVERDEWNRPIAYHFHQKHPGDYEFGAGFERVGNGRIRVPADEIIHPFQTERAGQTRGMPWVASAILRLHHMAGYEQGTVIGARAAASLMGFIESPEGEIHGDDEQDGERVTDFQPGVFKYLAPGEKVNVPNLNRPNGEFDPFMKAMLRATASGLGVSYESLSKDYSSATYSSARQALLSDRDNWRVIQAWAIAKFHQIVFENWLDMAVLSGELRLPDYETNPDRYRAVRWMPRGWAWIDPTKEVAAYKEAIAGGLSSITDVVAQQGGDVEEVMQTIKRERARAKELGLVFDTDAANEAQIAKAKVNAGSSQVTENQ